MKQVIITVLCALIMAAPSYGLTNSGYTCDDDGGIVTIPLEGVNNNNEGGMNNGGYRTPGVRPISCYFSSTDGNVYSVFLYDMGAVDIHVENQTDCTVVSDTVLSSAGLVSTHVPGSPGHYVVTYTLTDGTRYRGVFDIS